MLAEEGEHRLEDRLGRLCLFIRESLVYQDRGRQTGEERRVQRTEDQVAICQNCETGREVSQVSRRSFKLGATVAIPHSHFAWIRTLVGDDDRAQGRIPPDVPCSESPLVLSLQIVIERKVTNRTGHSTRHRQKRKVERRGYPRTYLSGHEGQLESNIERPSRRPPHDQDEVCEGSQ